MSLADRRNRDKEMAAALKRRGIFHGKRVTQGINNIPSMADVGSAAYRRRVAKVRDSFGGPSLIFGRWFRCPATTTLSTAL